MIWPGVTQAVAITGSKKKSGKWSQVAQMVPGRKSLQCRERWCNVLDPDLKIGACLLLACRRPRYL